MTKIVWELPLKTVSEANSSEHWTVRSKRHRQQKRFICLLMRKDIAKVTLPCHITLTRLSPRELDYDNMVISQKYVLDSICDLLIPGLRPGRADGDKRITVTYRQKKSPIVGVRIEIDFSADSQQSDTRDA